MINGNTTATIQVSTATKNEVGEAVKTWATVQTLNGWLDLSSGDSKYSTYSAKLQESTHIFICDYEQLEPQIKAETARMEVGGKRYDILLIDNPMELNKQLEFYLKYTGGQLYDD